MAHYTAADIKWSSKTAVALPQKLIFDYMADFSSTRLWDPCVIDACLKHHGQGTPINQGAQFQLVFDSLFSKNEMSYEIVRYLPPHEIHLKGTNDIFESYDIIRISQDKSQKNFSFVDYSIEMTLHKKNAVMLAFMKFMTKHMCQKVMRTIKRLGLPDTGRPRRVSSLLWRTLLPFFWQCTRLGYQQIKKYGYPLPVSNPKKVVITGCTSGIGQEIAFELARAGCSIIMINRSASKAEALKQLLELRFKTRVESYIADLSSTAETIDVASTIAAKHDSLDVLINNAGALIHQRQQTAEGFEFHFALHVMAPFILMARFLPLLKNRHCKGPGRIINMCSGGLYAQPLHLKDLQFQHQEFNGSEACARSKRALLDITQEAARLYDRDEIVFHAMHPGWAATEGVAAALPRFHRILKPFLRTPYQGADTAVWLALSYVAGHSSGHFWLDRKIQPNAIIYGTETRPDQQSILFATVESLLAADTTAAPLTPQLQQN